MSENKVLLDNWTLELAASVLEGAISPQYSDALRNEQVICQKKLDKFTQFTSYMWDSVNIYEVWNDVNLNRKYNNVDPKNSVRYEMGQSLLHFLDLIIMYDTLVVDSEMAFTWERFESMKLISPIVSKVRLGDSTKATIQSSFPNVPTEIETEVVSQGALYYLGLANLLGLDYWAAPKRAEFLSKNLNCGYKKGFVSVLGNFADEKMHSLAQEFLQNSLLKDLQNSIYFPGFGASVLLNCRSRTEVLEKAFAFRQSQECKAFRAWINEMDNATEEGNLNFIIKNISDIQILIDDLQKNLGEQKFYGKVELEIGLSPSLTFDSKAINSILEKFKPKKLHLSFLRHHFYKALEGSNIWAKIWRLFPELRI